MKEVFRPNITSITSDGGRLIPSEVEGEAMTPRAAGIASGDARPRWTAPELTNPSSSPRLKGEVIFMSQDNQGEIPRVNPQPPVESRGQRPQNLTLIERRQELAREYFNRVNAGRVWELMRKEYRKRW